MLLNKNIIIISLVGSKGLEPSSTATKESHDFPINRQKKQDLYPHGLPIYSLSQRTNQILNLNSEGVWSRTTNKNLLILNPQNLTIFTNRQENLTLFSLP